MSIDRAAVTNNANSKVLRIERIVEDRGTPTPQRMEAIAAIVDEWRSGVGPVHARPAPRPDLVDLLRQADALLSDARFDLHDSGLARSWGQQKRRLRDAILSIVDREGTR